MKKPYISKIFFTIGFLILTLPYLFSSTVQGADEVQVEDLLIFVPHSIPKTRYDNPVWVLGVWNFVNITLNSDISNIYFVFYSGSGDTLPDFQDRDETNYYIWGYENGFWNDTFHDNKYIRKNLCKIKNTTYCFNIGIDQGSASGNWTLRIYSGDGKQIYYQNIYVENAVIDLTLKSYPVEIKVEPFKSDHYISEEEFIIENNGNLPLDISIDYGRYNNIFDLGNSNVLGVLTPDSEKKSNLSVYSQSSWQPGELIIDKDIFIIGDGAPYIIPSKKEAVSVLETTVRYGLSTILKIGRFGYEIESLVGDITFEYEKQKNLVFGEESQLFAYVSGNGEINIDIRSENLEIISIFSGSIEVGTHFSINSKNDSEYPILIRLKGVNPNSTGKIYYELETGGVTDTFHTTITVGSIRPSEVINKDFTFIIELLIILCVASVFIYMVVLQLKHKKKNKK